MKRFRWLIVPLLATSISGCAFIREEARRAHEAEVQGRWEEAARRTWERRAQGQALGERDMAFVLAFSQLMIARHDLDRARREKAVNLTPATWGAYHHALLELDDAMVAYERARVALRPGDAAWEEVIRLIAERQEREREAREREERHRGGNGGGD